MVAVDGDDMKEITIITMGMTCTSCERAISNALMKVDGVKEARADYASETAKIRYDEKKVDVKKIKEAVENAGYDFGGEVKIEEKKGFGLPFLG